MRKFRFVGDPDNYDWDEKPIIGNTYPETHFGTKEKKHYKPLNYKNSIENESWVDHPEDWEEVFEDKTMITDSPVTFTSHSKQLHKDTDLGYYAGMFAANGCDVSVAIWRAKELIKQLDQEAK